MVTILSLSACLISFLKEWRPVLIVLISLSESLQIKFWKTFPRSRVQSVPVPPPSVTVVTMTGDCHKVTISFQYQTECPSCSQFTIIKNENTIYGIDQISKLQLASFKIQKGSICIFMVYISLIESYTRSYVDCIFCQIFFHFSLVTSFERFKSNFSCSRKCWIFILEKSWILTKLGRQL